MPQYRYRALAQGGEIVVGEVEAPSDDEVLRRIEYLGHLPIDTEVVKPSVLGRSSGIGRKLPRARDVTIFLRQLALLIGAGLPLEAALQTLGGHGTPVKKATTSEVIQQIQAQPGTIQQVTIDRFGRANMSYVRSIDNVSNTEVRFVRET